MASGYPSRKFSVNKFPPSGLGKDWVVITSPKAGFGGNRKMNIFHSGGKKCTIIYSARHSSHMILAVESSTSHPER